MTVYVRPYKHNPKKFEYDIKLDMPDGTVFRERKVSKLASRSGTQRYAEAREREVILAGCAPQKPKRKACPTLAKFWPSFIDGHALANKQKPSGIESKQYHFRQYLAPVLGALRLDDITTAKISELKRYMTTQLGADPTHKSKRGKASSTVNGCISTLSKCLKCAVDWGVIEVMPCKLERLKKSTTVPRFYDFEPYEQLVAAARGLDPRIELVVLLGGDAGLRRGEILALEQARCDTRTGKLLAELNQVGKHVHETKGMECRTIPMTARLRASLAANRHLRGPRVLYQDDGAPVSARTLRGWLTAAQRAAGFARATGEVHILRHTFCSHLAMRGAPVTVIQKLAGHKHLTTTIRYMSLAQGETDRAIRLLEPGEIREKVVASPENSV
jgi:site-specific recombinase XerD